MIDGAFNWRCFNTSPTFTNVGLPMLHAKGTAPPKSTANPKHSSLIRHRVREARTTALAMVKADSRLHGRAAPARARLSAGRPRV